MKPDFTPAAWRVLAEAARWTSCADDAPLALPEVLLGLLTEEECRAAALLVSRGIDGATIRRRWPQLRQVAEFSPARSSDFSLPLQAAFSEAHSRLRELPQPLSLATEHLLLGILAAPSEVCTWLLDQGLRVEVVQEQIFRWEGVAPGPLEMTESAECGVRNAECKDYHE